MSKPDRTSAAVATLASKTLQPSSASAVQRSLAGGALARAGTAKRTSLEVPSTAGKVLANRRASAVTKDLAGSVLEQRKR